MIDASLAKWSLLHDAILTSFWWGLAAGITVGVFSAMAVASWIFWLRFKDEIPQS